MKRTKGQLIMKLYGERLLLRGANEKDSAVSVWRQIFELFDLHNFAIVGMKGLK